MNRTYYFKNKPKICGSFTVAGPKESNGSVKDYIMAKKLTLKL